MYSENEWINIYIKILSNPTIDIIFQSVSQKCSFCYDTFILIVENEEVKTKPQSDVHWTCSLFI